MAVAILCDTETIGLRRIPADDRHGWGFALLLAVVATLFLRPADLVPAFDAWPVYQFLIACSLIVSFRASLRQLAQRHLVEQPVTACLLALLLAVGVSHLSHGFIWGARTSMYEVSKLLALYLLITGLVNTPQRLTVFVKWLTIAIATVAALALLDRFEFITIGALESVQDHARLEGGRATPIERIRGTGIFQDPNDFGLILVTGLILCSSFVFKPGAGLLRYAWLVPAGVLLSTLALTHSRGALLSLLCAAPAALCYSRAGKWGGWLLLGLPLVLLVFSDRMTDIDSIHEGTGQSRLQIWSDSLTVWRQYPLFGLGEGLLVDETGMVSHNSFLHCYAELGVFGGTAFLASFVAAGLGLWSLREQDPDPKDSPPSAPGTLERARLNGFIFAALLAYAAGTLTISRQFVAPTYLLLGLATAAAEVSFPVRDVVRWRIGNRFLLVASLSSAAALLAFYLAVRIFVRW